MIPAQRGSQRPREKKEKQKKRDNLDNYQIRNNKFALLALILQTSYFCIHFEHEKCLITYLKLTIDLAL